MTKNEVIKETLNRLFICRASTNHRTREEDWLESILRILIGIPEDQEILVDLDILSSFPDNTDKQ